MDYVGAIGSSVLMTICYMIAGGGVAASLDEWDTWDKAEKRASLFVIAGLSFLGTLFLALAVFFLWG